MPRNEVYRSPDVHCIHSVAFSPHGRLLAASSRDATMKLWDPVTGVLEHTVRLSSSLIDVSCISFSPDGRLLASCHGHDRITLRDPATGEHKYGLDGKAHSVCFSPNSQLLASSYGNDIELWDPSRRTRHNTLERQSSWVVSMAFSSDGRVLASGAADGTIKLWNLVIGVTGSQSILYSHRHTVRSVAFSPDGKLLASCSSDWTVKLWETATGALKHTLENRADYSAWPTFIIFSPDNQLLASGSLNMTVNLWYSVTGIFKHALKKNSGEIRPVTSVSFSLNGQLLASGVGELFIDLWDLTTGKLKQTFDGHTSPVFSTAFSPNGQLLATGSKYEIMLWDLTTGTLKHIIEPGSAVQSIAFLPNGKLLGSGSNQDIKFWDPDTGAHKNTLKADSVWDSDNDFSRGPFYFAAKLQCFTAQDWQSILLPDFLSTMKKPYLQGGQWVSIRGQRELWLPPDFRSDGALFNDTGVTTVKDGAIALGCGNGRVHVITFSI